MPRKLFIKDKKRGVYIGQFPPSEGWQNGRKGIRRVLCKINELEHLEQSQAAKKLTEIYHVKQWEINNAKLVAEQERKEKKKQLSNISMRAASTKWLAEIKLLKSDKTYKNYRGAITYYFNCFNDHPLKTFDREKNIEFYDYLATKVEYRNKPLSRETQNTLMRYLQTFLTWCYDNEMIDKKFKLKRIAVPKRDIETFSIKNLQTLKLHIAKRLKIEQRPREIINLKNMQRAFYMASNSLLRLGALDAMLISWIDLEDRIIRVRSNEERNFENKKLKQPNKPINQQLYDFLEQDLSSRNPKEIYFLDNGYGQPWYSDKSDVSSYATKLCKECNLPKLKPFHWGMRGTMITWLLNNGAKVTDVQQLADHDSVETTMKYFNSRTVQQKNAVDTLPKI